MSETGHSATGYIIHHLTNLRFDLAQMKFLHGEETGGFGVVHVDTMLFSLALGALFLWLFTKAAKSATSGVPGGLQNFCEIMVEFVDSQVKDCFHAAIRDRATGADHFYLGVPVERDGPDPGGPVPAIAGLLGIPYLRSVPSTDMNSTFGLSISVLLLLYYYGFKVKVRSIFPWRS